MSSFYYECRCFIAPVRIGFTNAFYHIDTVPINADTDVRLELFCFVFSDLQAEETREKPPLLPETETRPGTLQTCDEKDGPGEAALTE